MGFLFFKTRKDTIQFSRDFYEVYLFGPNALGVSLPATYAETVYNSICKTDPAFISVDLAKLKTELLALQLEMIGTAWTHKSKESAAVANSEFTKRYLAEKGLSNLWPIMGEYNQRVAASVTYGSDSSTACGRGKIAFLNSMRMQLFDSWHAKGHDAEAVARVINRLMASIKNPILPSMLGFQVIARVETEASDTAVDHLAAVAYGFYQGANDALRGIRLAT